MYGTKCIPVICSGEIDRSGIICRSLRCATVSPTVRWSSYKALADKEDKVIFGGRLGEYKYYDMDQVIAAALTKAEELLPV